VRREIERIPSNPLSLAQISSWASKCNSGHPGCSSSPSILPTRVLDVSALDQSVHLHVSSDQYGHYIALSHCWGTLPITTTTKASLAQHIQNIELCSLPKTFCDAIDMARHLGIPYLWIDSLCIVQDDAEDWARESARMAKIYNEAYLTIAATGARDGSEGLFKARDVEELEFPIPGSNGEALGTIYARRGRRHDKLMRGNLIAGQCDPLICRAWVYQERLLSSKLLHFGSEEMVWLCNGARDCECGLLPEEDDGGRSLFEALKSSSSPDSITASPQRIQKGIQGTSAEIYHRMINDYTMLLLTKSFDRLPAFSGIASVLFSPENYLAGLRRSHIAQDLLWAPYGQTRRPDMYLAPSWSWASIEGHVYYPSYSDYPDDTESRLFDVKEILTKIDSIDPFGRVRDGKLVLEGPCVAAMISKTSKFGYSPIVNPGDYAEEWCDFLSDATDEDGQDVISPWAGREILVLGGARAKARVVYLVLVKEADNPIRYKRIGRGSIELEGNEGNLIASLGNGIGEGKRELIII
jgi:hypothetical protein